MYFVLLLLQNWMYFVLLLIIIKIYDYWSGEEQKISSALIGSYWNLLNSHKSIDTIDILFESIHTYRYQIFSITPLLSVQIFWRMQHVHGYMITTNNSIFYHKTSNFRRKLHFSFFGSQSYSATLGAIYQNYGQIPAVGCQG